VIVETPWVKCPKCYERMWLLANSHRCGWKRKGNCEGDEVNIFCELCQKETKHMDLGLSEDNPCNWKCTDCSEYNEVE